MADSVKFYYTPTLDPFVCARELAYCDYVVTGPRDYGTCDGGVDEVAAFPVYCEAFAKCFKAARRAGAYVAFIYDDDAPAGGNDTAEYRAWLEGFCEGAAYLRRKCADWQALREDREAAGLA